VTRRIRICCATASCRLRRKRAIFARTLEEVVVPGLEQFGIDGSPARAWLCARIR